MHAVMFHHFHDNKKFIATQGSISAEELKEIIRHYEAEGYQFLRAKDWYEKAVSDQLKVNQVALTFDDGLKCQSEIGAQILEELGLTGFFFVPSLRFEGKMEYLEVFREFAFSQFNQIEDFYNLFFKQLRLSKLGEQYQIKEKLNQINFEQYLQEFEFYTYEDRMYRYFRDIVLTEEEYKSQLLTMMRDCGYDINASFQKLYMSEEDLKCLTQKGHVIGLHSHSHYTNLASTSRKRQREEYFKNKEILERIVGKKIQVAAYPCNSYNQDTINIMKELGIKVAFRSNLKKGYLGLLEVPRQDHINIIKEAKHQKRSRYGKSV